VARRGIRWRRRHDQSVVLLVVAVAIAVAAVVVTSYSLAWWLLVLAALAAGLGAAVPWMKKRAKGVDTRVELMGKCLRALDDRGRLRIVDELSLTDFGVHPAHIEVEYLPRAREANVVATLAEGRPVRVVGSSMAGKTRMAVQVVRDHYSDWPAVVPVPPRGLLDLVEGGGVPRGAVVWLDDLDRYLAGGGFAGGGLGSGGARRVSGGGDDARVGQPGVSRRRGAASAGGGVVGAVRDCASVR
jgi:hypothetical protein